MIKFTKFEDGKMTPAEGELIELNDKFVVVKYEDNNYQFSRLPGPKSGFLTGKGPRWRLNIQERDKYCSLDLPKRLRK